MVTSHSIPNVVDSTAVQYSIPPLSPNLRVQQFKAGISIGLEHKVMINIDLDMKSEFLWLLLLAFIQNTSNACYNRCTNANTLNINTTAFNYALGLQAYCCQGSVKGKEEQEKERELF